MKYYVGYFNKPWDKSEFTVICACPDKYAASFILKQYQEKAMERFTDTYKLLTAAEIMDLKLIF